LPHVSQRITKELPSNSVEIRRNPKEGQMRQQLFGQGLSCPTSRSVVVLIVILVIYGIFLASKVGAYAGGSDSSGYLNDARLLSARAVDCCRQRDEVRLTCSLSF
jgi:hypothetical protein